MTHAIASAGIVHKIDRVGSNGYPTICGVMVAKADGQVAKLSYGQGWPTSPLGWLCKICFGGEK